MAPQSKPPSPPRELSKRLARKILGQIGENGTPPEIGIAHVNVGNETYLHILDQVYVEDVLLETDGSTFKLVQGTYGAGKTHFLYCVRDLVSRRGLCTALVTISPKECPLNKPLGVYRAVAQQIQLPRTGDDGEEQDPVRGVDDILWHRLEERVAELGKDEARAWVSATLERAPITNHAFRHAVVRYLQARLDGTEESWRRLAAWLRGEALPPAEAKSEGLYEQPADHNGFAMLRSLVQTVVRVGFQGTALLFDEAERRLSIAKAQSKATSETVDHLRELVDLCGRSELPRTLMLYAVTPAFTQDILPAYPALQQRLGSPLQYLSPHNPKAPLIDLEALDLEPVKLLTEVGLRLLRVARCAYDWSPDEKLIQDNLRALADTVIDEQLEISHRRLFVKLWVRLLDELRLGGERAVSQGELQALVRDQQGSLLEEEETPPAGVAFTFLGEPVIVKKKPQPPPKKKPRA